MSVVVPEGSRPGLERAAGNHEARLRALERQANGGGSGEPWAMFLGDISAAADSGFQYVDMDRIVTSDPDVFALLPGTGANAGLHGPSVADPGAYRVEYTCDFGGTPGDELTQYYSGDIGIRSFWFFGWRNVVLAPAPMFSNSAIPYGHTNFSEIRIVGGPLWVGPVAPLPMGEIPYVQNVTAARAFTATITCHITKLGDDAYVTNIAAGSGF